MQTFPLFLEVFYLVLQILTVSVKGTIFTVSSPHPFSLSPGKRDNIKGTIFTVSPLHPFSHSPS